MSYAPSTLKSISDSEPYHPQNLDEIRGDLIRLLLKDSSCIAFFCFGTVAFPAELEPRLRGLVGKEIACLCFDGKFYLRMVGGLA